ncbi:hypothetical protein ACX0G9_02570 [Flavitalea flava]
MKDNKLSIDELSEKVLLGMRKALRKLAEISAANNEDLVVADKDGKFKSIPAKDLLQALPQ